jgi:hypothetical protein
VLKHVSDSFKLGFGRLVDEGFEFVASGHGRERIPCLSRLINVRAVSNARRAPRLTSRPGENARPIQL